MERLFCRWRSEGIPAASNMTTLLAHHGLGNYRAESAIGSERMAGMAASMRFPLYTSPPRGVSLDVAVWFGFVFLQKD